jgi:hypothetical protein
MILKTLKPIPAYCAALEFAAVDSLLDAVDCEIVHVDGGRTKTLYTFGSLDNECLILLPPIGMSFLLIAHLARELAKDYYVISWESMGCPDVNVAMVEGDDSLQNQALEFHQILRCKNIEHYHFVGWCQAVQKMMVLNTMGGPMPESMCLLAPSGLDCGVITSEFEQCALPIYLKIDQEGQEYGAKMGKILDTMGNKPSHEDQLAERLSLAHLSSPEATYRFAKYMRSFEQSKPLVKPLLDGVFLNIQTLLIHCKDDNFSHYSESVQLAAKYPSIELDIVPRGGHLLMFNQATLTASKVQGFIQRCEQQVT